MIMTMNSMSDLRTWEREHAMTAGDDRARTIELGDALAEQVREMDHPAWGEDWAEFLGALDVGEMLCAAAFNDPVDQCVARAVYAAVRSAPKK